MRSVTRAVLLVRHTEVACCWRGRCYGASDTGLSRQGRAQMYALVPELVAWKPERIVHSGLRRSAVFAEAVGRAASCAVSVDPRWRERGFGDWEGVSWSAIYRTSGSAMDGMIDAPASFRPGGGETTMELAERAMAAFAALPSGRTLVVAHGGSIAALRGSRDTQPVTSWLGLVPACGETVQLVDGND